MPKRRITPAHIAAHIRRVLKDGGSAPHAEDVQWFFKEVVKSRGWYTAELRKLSVRFQRSIRREMGLTFLIEVADKLFSGRVLEEKVVSVLMLQTLVEEFGDKEFKLFESWIDRITSWADHDALAHYLLAPMIVLNPPRARRVFRWAKSKNRWHRRAACVALIQGTRLRMFRPEVVKLSDLLLTDEDDMVQKGLGWLLRETAKADAKRTLPYLIKIRARAPRLVLRTACETLTQPMRARVMARLP
ncbi:MAG TPA: DNA alkylation repair protein [Terriglobales bacterium]|jgi:3-methyladenine DNA glycosylase AlkD